MITQVKELLDVRGWQNVAIIDDAYDHAPSLDDIPSEKWDTFFDDLKDDDRELLRESYPDYGQYSESIDLVRAPGFVQVVWSLKNDLSAGLSALVFDEYEQDQKNKQGELVELEALLAKLGLNISKNGRSDAHKAIDSHIIFLDLFIGAVNTPEAYQHSVALIKEVVSRHKGSPPVVILMSTSPRIEKLGPQLRDDADLLGSLFRKMRKSDLTDEGAILERIFDLALIFDDALKLLSFQELWHTTLNKSVDQFLKMIRKLDLPDYANIHSLVIDAEGAEIGEYMIDLFDVFLHNVIEGSPDLISAANNLNEVQWNQYPPPHFSPSVEAVDILEGAIFHNTVRTALQPAVNKQPRLHLGDVIWQYKDNETGTDNAGETPVPSVNHNVLVLLTQSCDLLRNETDTLLFMRGTAYPYSLKYHKKPSKDITPIVTVDNQKYIINWNPKLLETWKVDNAGAKLLSGEFKVVRRFRHSFALQLQQSFLSTIGRVGVPSPLPGYYPVGAKIFYRDNSSKAFMIKDISRDENIVTCLAGRDESQVITKIIFDREFIDILRNELNKIQHDNFHSDAREKILLARDDIKFYMTLRHPLKYSKSQRERPLSDIPNYDIIHLFNKPTLKHGGKLDAKDGPLIIEIVE